MCKPSTSKSSNFLIFQGILVYGTSVWEIGGYSTIVTTFTNKKSRTYDTSEISQIC